MEQIEATSILRGLREVIGSHINDMHIRYDEAADTLYISFGAPLAADDSELGDDNILYRYKNGELVGITATHFSKR